MVNQHSSQIKGRKEIFSLFVFSTCPIYFLRSPTYPDQTVSINQKIKGMKKYFGVLAFMFVASSFRCETAPSVPSENGADQCTDILWLQPYIDGLKNNTDVKSEVIRYKYKGQIVYYIDSCKGCADSMAVVYNCTGEVVCQFGGIAGFNTCPDFKSASIAKKVIFSN